MVFPIVLFPSSDPGERVITPLFHYKKCSLYIQFWMYDFYTEIGSVTVQCTFFIDQVS